MLDLDNRTDWVAGLYPGWDRARAPQMTLVFKTAWRFDDDGRLEPEPLPLVEADAHYGKPHESSLRAACETVPFKQGGELLLQGTAHPARAGDRHALVGVEIDFPDGRRFRKRVAVFGRRQWRRGLLGPVPGDPEPMAPTPLRYEQAFGGADPKAPEERWPLNPVGMGWAGRSRRVAGLELPRLERPEQLITRPGQCPPPAGFGPLPVFWQPRADEAGSPVEEPETQGGCPWGADAEPVLHNCAPPDQRFPHPFVGGERIRLQGLFPGRPAGEPVSLTVPKLAPRPGLFVAGRATALQPLCDTLLIDTDARTLALVWRVGIPWRRLDPRQGWVVLEDATLAAGHAPAPQRVREARA